MRVILVTIRTVRVAVLAGAVVLGLVRSSYAAPITWGTPVDIAGNTDVSTNGTGIFAFNFNGPTTTVNGVTFQRFDLPFGSASVSMGNLALASTFFTGTQNTGTVTPPFTSLSAAYQQLLGSAIGFISDVNVTISGLTVGRQYQFQGWAHNSNSGAFHFPTDFIDPFNNTVTLFPGDATVLGQFVIGTFTADAVTQQLTFGVQEASVVNGVQLRELTPVAAVPESGSLTLLGVGLFCLAAVFRRTIR